MLLKAVGGVVDWGPVSKALSGPGEGAPVVQSLDLRS
jgi:hypothetical protein